MTGIPQHARVEQAARRSAIFADAAGGPWLLTLTVGSERFVGRFALLSQLRRGDGVIRFCDQAAPAD